MMQISGSLVFWEGGWRLAGGWERGTEFIRAVLLHHPS